jgi:hypothetical protein
VLVLISIVVVLLLIAVLVARWARCRGRFLPTSGTTDLGQAPPPESSPDDDDSLIGNRPRSGFSGSDGGRGW